MSQLCTDLSRLCHCGSIHLFIVQAKKQSVLQNTQHGITLCSANSIPFVGIHGDRRCVHVSVDDLLDLLLNEAILDGRAQRLYKVFSPLVDLVVPYPQWTKCRISAGIILLMSGRCPGSLIGSGSASCSVCSWDSCVESAYFCHPCHSCMVGVLMSSVLFPLKLSCFLTSNSLADVVGNQDAKDQDDASL